MSLRPTARLSARAALCLTTPLVIGAVTNHAIEATVFALGSLWAISQDGTDAWAVRSRRLAWIGVAVAVGFFVGTATGTWVTSSVGRVGVVVLAALISGVVQASGAASAGMYGLLGVIVGGAFSNALSVIQTPILATAGVAWVIVVAAIMDRRGRHLQIRRALADALDSVASALASQGATRRFPARASAVTALDLAQDAVGPYPPRRDIDEGIALRQCLLIALRVGELVSYLSVVANRPVHLPVVRDLASRLRTGTARDALNNFNPDDVGDAPVDAARAVRAALRPADAAVALRWAPRTVARFRVPWAERWRFGALLATSVAVASWVAIVLRGTHGYWLPMSVAFILRPDLGPVLRRSLARIAGTLGGVAIAALANQLGNRLVVLIVLSCLMAVMMPPAIRRGHAYAVMTFTPIVFSFIAVLGPDHNLLVPRIVDTVVAAVLVLIVDLVVWTNAPSLRPAAQFARAQAAVASYLATDIEVPVPDRRLRRRSAVRAVGDALSSVTMAESELTRLKRTEPSLRTHIRGLFDEIDRHTVELIESSLPARDDPQSPA